MAHKVAILGGGNMGYAFASSMIREEVVSSDNLYIVDRDPATRLRISTELGCHVAHEIDQNIVKFDYIIVAVKPQSFVEVGRELAAFITDKQFIISIMAGVTIAAMEKVLSTPLIVRAMPNTPCQYGKGVTGYYMTDVTEDKTAVVQQLLEATGKAVKVDSESDIDAVTAISGSGPAYFYYFVQSLTEAAKGLGLKQDVAELLVEQTMQGAEELIHLRTGSYEDLINAVKSKGGTTEAALLSFEEDNFKNILAKAVTKARDRAGVLSKMIEDDTVG